MSGVDAVLHTASLHKPHVAFCSRQAFIEDGGLRMARTVIWVEAQSGDGAQEK